MNRDISQADLLDLKEILQLQYLAYQSEADLFGSRDIPPLKQTLEEVEAEYRAGIILKLMDDDGKIIGSVRAKEKDNTVFIGKLMVHPDYQCQGYGKALLCEIEKRFPGKRYELFTSTRSADNLRLYQNLGYRIFKHQKITEELEFVFLEKGEKCGSEYAGGPFMKPIIGVMPLWDDEKESIWMLPGYLDGIQQAGGLPFIFPFTTDENDLKRLAGMCDGFLFTGGHDVSPDIYHEEPLKGLVSCCRRRDEMETVVLREAIETGKPILGICRGIQFINAALGGTLYQDLPSQHPSETEHHQKAPYDIPAHGVKIVRDTPLYDCLNLDQLQVNSCHHQAVKDLAPGLEIMAVSPDGLTEALYMPKYRFLWAVQWHPEFSYKTDQNSRRIFSAFIEASAR